METNPYAAPQSDIIVPSTGGGELATPWIRLGASFVDGLVILPINWILQKLLLKMPTPADLIRASQDAAANGQALDVKSLMPGTGA
jgi:hypothetical protein